MTSLFLLAAALSQAPPPDLNALEEQAMQAAVLKVAPSIVQIETSGGADLLRSGAPGGDSQRRGSGPTTGLVVASDGYIISSAFNFASRPSAIFVTVPGRSTRYVARVVATDQTRMLTLLRIEATGLPVPVAAAKKDFRVGQWSLALGRTWAGPEAPPSVSVGVLSALARIWGKAIQTDAKVSPVNYGGPLVDIRGRVQGVLVPASPHGEDETAGFEWYDSGIGFAIPLEDIFAVLPRLREGKDLRRGLLGVLLRGQDLYGGAPVVASVAPDSAAGRAGVQSGDTVVKVDGQPVGRQAQMRHALGNKYEGDTVSVTVRRSGKEIDFRNLRLAGPSGAFVASFLGILPVRDDPEPGVEVRFVYPRGPADTAGIRPGDRVLALGPADVAPKPVPGRDELMAMLASLPPGAEVKLQVRRKGSNNTAAVSTRLADIPDTVPTELPGPATSKRALEPRKAPGSPIPPRPPPGKPETGFLERTNAGGDRPYWVYVPEDYDANVAYAVVVWLHPAHGAGARAGRELANRWQPFCREQHLILVGPQAQTGGGWLFSEADAVQEVTREILSLYTTDAGRVAVFGAGSGGNLAIYLGFHARDLVRGVAAVDGVLAGEPAEGVPAQRLSFFLAAGSGSPVSASVAQTQAKLVDKKYPVVYRPLSGPTAGPLDDKTLRELVRWIDSLDRL